MGIDQFCEIYRIYLLEIIPIYDVYTTGRRNKYELEVYVDLILKVFKTGISWYLVDNNIYGDTIRKKYIKWIKLGIFDKIYSDLKNNYLENNSIQNLYVDSTDIANVNGYLDFGYNYKHKNKKAIKITTIIDDNQFPLFDQINKASVHDTKIMDEIIDNNILDIQASYHNPVYIAADKGYVCKKIKDKLKDKNIIYATPNKKNKKKKQKLTKKYKECLKNRFKIEQYFSFIKRSFKRIKNIVDRSMVTYNSFLLIASSVMIIRSAF